MVLQYLTMSCNIFLVLESLISVNNKLGQKEAAAGLLEWGRKNLPGDLKVQERWYEKLHDWEKALSVYKEKSDENPNDPELVLGQMRCLEALGEWGDLHDVAEAHWPVAEQETKNRMSRMSASAAWGRRDWQAMSRFAEVDELTEYVSHEPHSCSALQIRGTSTS